MCSTWEFFFTVFMLLFAIPVTQTSAENVSSPEQQASKRISPDDAVACEEGLELVWEYDGTPVCVEPEKRAKTCRVRKHTI